MVCGNRAADGIRRTVFHRLTSMDVPQDLGPTMNDEDVESILAIRLLIARAGNRDSLGWWDDDSLSVSAEFVLQRMFPVEPPLAGRRLALEAAFARHQALAPADPHIVHLYRLDSDNRDRWATRFHMLESIPVPAKPIDAPDALRAGLIALTGKPMPYEVERHGPGATVKIVVPPGPADTDALLHRARTLAWAYLEARPGQCVIPYCAEPQRIHWPQS